MAIETGNGKPEKKENTENKKNNTADTESTQGSGQTKEKETPSNDTALQKMLEEMAALKNELAEIKNQKQQPGGITTELISEVVKAVGDNGKNFNEQPFGKQYVKDLDPEDFDKKGVTFCAYSIMIVIVGDVRQGRDVRTPFGNVIKFMYQATKRQGVGKHQTLSSYCSYTSHSKKEIKWLREHTLYGFGFFESAKAALSVDARKAQALSRIIINVDGLEPHQVVARCKEYEVPLNDDMKTMKILLAHKIADRQYIEEVEANKQRAILGNEKHLFPDLGK